MEILAFDLQGNPTNLIRTSDSHIDLSAFPNTYDISTHPLKDRILQNPHFFKKVADEIVEVSNTEKDAIIQKRIKDATPIVKLNQPDFVTILSDIEKLKDEVKLLKKDKGT